MTDRFWRSLHRAINEEDKKYGKYGVRLHKKLIRYIFDVFEVTGLKSTRRAARDVTLLTYEIAECMRLSTQSGKECEIRVYVNKDGIRLFQAATIGADSPPPSGSSFLSILSRIQEICSEMPAAVQENNLHFTCTC